MKKSFKQDLAFFLAVAANVLSYFIVSYYIFLGDYPFATAVAASGILINTSFILLKKMFPKR